MLFFRVNSRALMATGVFLIFIFFLTSDMVQDSSVGSDKRQYLGRLHHQTVQFGGASRPGYFYLPPPVKPGEAVFPFASVSDLDQLSRVPESNKLSFKSILLSGSLKRMNDGTYGIKFYPQREIFTGHNEAGRGMELSELTLYQNRLLAFDDRTGSVFELLNKNRGADTYAVPRLIITEGQGDTDKGMKWEWATVKGDNLYIGSMGKEYTNPDGSIANTNNLWIAVVNPKGEVTRKDWTPQYDVVRAALRAESPGYVIHEAVLWSEYMKKWVFAPRRVSSKAYDEVKDERMGNHHVVLVDEGFKKTEVVEIKYSFSLGEVDPLRGFSTIAFIPGTKDTEVLAVRSVEEDCVGGDEAICKQRSYFSVFNVVTGEVLMSDVRVNMDVKFEGVEFVYINTPEL